MGAPAGAPTRGAHVPVRPVISHGLPQQLTQAAAPARHPPPLVTAAITASRMGAAAHPTTPGNPPAIEEEEEDACTCVVCFERDRDTMLEPCSHCVLCSQCCEEVMRKTKQCPICRADIREFCKVEF